MTEVEWLACEDAEQLFALVDKTRRTSQRVFRLFCAAFWGWHARHCPTTPLMPSANRAALIERVAQLERWAETGVPPPRLDRAFACSNRRARVDARGTVVLARQWLHAECGGPDVPVMICSLLRDAFGSPFRRIKPNRAWLTRDVLALARGTYEERAFDRTPILADALEDAGCADETVLSHLRSPGPHVRGCWVLDLVLGKE